MQLTEKTRKGILLFLTELSQADAERIATTNGVSVSTVYRIFKKIREGKPVDVDNITLALTEMAVENKRTHSRFEKLSRQLSPSKRKLAVQKAA